MDSPVSSDFRTYYDTARHEPIYVILGVQGSGTNLLGRLLTRLYGFSVLRDRSIVFSAAARLGNAPSAADVEREIRWIERAIWPSAWNRKTGRHFIPNSELYDGLGDALRAAGIASGAEFAHLVYAYRAFSLKTRRIAIKSDDLWEHVHLMDQVIPNRRLIMLTRDFRDNLLSISGKEFGPIEPVCGALYVKKQLAHYIPAYERSGKHGYHLKFETLLNETRRFVDDFSRDFAIEPIVDPDVAVPALKFRPNKIGKWKKLPADELAWCEGLLREELQTFGYELYSAQPRLPGRYQIAAATARDTVKRVPQKLRRLRQRLSK